MNDFYPLIAALLAMILSQIIKIFIFSKDSIKNNYRSLFGSGGMPSSHTAMVLALSTSLYIQDGLKSHTFFISIIFSLIVLYDAMGVRKEVGKHSVFLNHLSTLKKDKEDNVEFSEAIGHTFFEVFIGGVLGVVTATLLYLMI